MQPKFCLNCKYVKTWDYPGGREEPPDSGFECSQELEDLDLCDESFQSDEECAQIYAKDCLGYEFFDWEQHHKDQAESEPQTLKDISQQAEAYYAAIYQEFEVN